MKQKKVTIKPFLNTYIGPVGTETDSKGSRDIYALYYKVTYDRRNTQLKSSYAPSGYSIIEQAEEIVTFELNILTKIVEYEITQNSDKDYQLAGLKARFEAYSKSVVHSFDEFLRKKLYGVVQRINHPYQHALRFDNYLGRMTVITLLEMCDKLFSDFDKYIDKTFREELECFALYDKLYEEGKSQYVFATLIDWMTGTHQHDLMARLKKIGKDDKFISRNVKIINSVVEDRLKNIAL